MGRTLIQRSLAECGVAECDQKPLRRRPWPTRGCCAMEKNAVRGRLFLL
jgi:hypothetical protein